MDWVYAIVAVAVVAAFFLMKRLRQVSASEVRAMLADGAKVIDVRSPEEFRRDPVHGAINIPLGNLATEIGRKVPDKQTPILVHCLSGGRSEVATVQLRGAGYTRVGNLGSVTRARSLVETTTS